MNSLFSVIIPVHNREKYIKDTLRSIVGQEYRPIQLILVDNNSSDNSIVEAKKYLSPYENEEFKVVYTTEEKPGACAARNKGATLALAPYMMFLDDDDALMNYKAISLIVDNFEKSRADIVGFKARLYWSYKKTKVRRYSFTSDIKEQILHCVLSTQCYAVTRELFSKSGGWDERIKRWQDWNLGVRLMLLNPKIEWIKTDPLVSIRVHEKSITGNGYLHSAEALEESVLLTAEDVDNSNISGKDTIIASIYGRLPILAAHYLREQGKEVSLRTIKTYFERVELSLLQKAVIYIVFIYTLFGGRGGGRVINKLKVKLNRTK